MSLSCPRASSMRFASGLESGAIIVLAPSSPHSLALRTRRPVNQCLHLVHPSSELVPFDLRRVLGMLDMMRVAGKAITKRWLAVTRPLVVVSFVQRGCGRKRREGGAGGGQCGIRSGHAEFVGAPKPGSGEGCVRARRGRRALANSWPGRAFLFKSRCPSFVLVHDLTEPRLAFSDSLFLSSSPGNEGQLCPFSRLIEALGWPMLSRVNLGVSQNVSFRSKGTSSTGKGLNCLKRMRRDGRHAIVRTGVIAISAMIQVRRWQRSGAATRTQHIEELRFDSSCGLS